MPLGVGIVGAQFRRDWHDRFLHQCPCSDWRAADPFLRGHTDRSGQMHPCDRKSRPPARVQNARCNLTGTADHPNSPSAFRSFPGSVSLEARATGTFLGRLAGGVSVTRRAPRMAPLMKSKLIMEIPPKLKEYLSKNRRQPKPKPTQAATFHRYWQRIAQICELSKASSKHLNPYPHSTNL